VIRPEPREHVGKMACPSPLLAHVPIEGGVQVFRKKGRKKGGKGRGGAEKRKEDNETKGRNK
jgi:hypothetical protein